MSSTSLLPQAPAGHRAGLGLALLAHAGLVLALALATRWRTQAPVEVSAELWAAVPQSAAPAALPPALPPALPTVVAPVVVPAVAPVPKPVPVAPTAQRDAEIAVEKAQAAIERKTLEAQALKKAEADAQKKKRDAEQAQVQAQAEAKEKLAAATAAKAEDERLAKQREDNLRRMLGQAGTTVGSTVSTTVSTNPSANAGTGTSAVSAAPSASYAGRLVAHIRPFIVLTAQINGNPSAEVEVRTASGGSILSRRLLKTSGQPDWDEAVLRAIDRAGSLPRDADGRVPPVLTLVFRPLD
jgi:colicin import membrane protein